MNLTILRSDEIEQEKWDDFIWQSREGNLFATYTHLQNCERKWKATILCNSDGSYRAVMPFQIKKSFGVTYIYQDPFSRELGIFTKEKLSPIEYATLVNTTFKHYRYVVRYHFNVDNHTDLQQIDLLGNGRLSQIYTYHLNLNQTYECIWKNYRKDRRYSIRRAKRYAQNIYESDELSQALTIFKENTFHRIPGLEFYQVALLKKLFAALLEQGKIEVNYLSLDEKPIAAAIIARYKQKVICLFTANTKQAFEFRSASLLLDHVIKKYAGQNLVFDFKGGGVDSLDDFFSSFGAERRMIYTYEQNGLPLPIQWLMASRRKFLKSKL